MLVVWVVRVISLIVLNYSDSNVLVKDNFNCELR